MMLISHKAKFLVEVYGPICSSKVRLIVGFGAVFYGHFLLQKTRTHSKSLLSLPPFRYSLTGNETKICGHLKHSRQASP